MTADHAADRLAERAVALESVLCVGLDPRGALPAECERGVRADRSGRARAVERYCIAIIEAVAPHAVAVKPQVALFEVLGGYGLTALDHVCAAAAEHGLVVIADAKRGDIGSTAVAYATAWLGSRAPGEGAVADMLTVNPYLGADSVEPFLARVDEGRGIFVLARTSNPGAADLQELELAAGGRVWERVAGQIAEWGGSRIGRHGLASVGAVVGLTSGQAIADARRLMPHAPLLIPGLGAQGGDPAAAAPAFSPHPAGGIVSASRSIIEAWRGAEGDWRDAVAEAARAHRDALREPAFSS